MPRFSVIVPVFNRPQWLAATLASVAGQDFADYELIVVDDGSTENVRQVVDQYPNVKFLRQDNLGPGAARNKGMQAATGDYLAFLDSDDLWFPWSLTVYDQMIRRSGNPTFVVGRAKFFEDPATLFKTDCEPVDCIAYPDYLSSWRTWTWFGTSSFVVCRTTALAVDGFCPHHMNAEDLDFALRIGTSPGYLTINAPYMLGYRSHFSGAVANLNNTLRGVAHLMNEEFRHRYPGGRKRSRQRLHIISRSVRPPSFAALKVGRYGDAWRLYLHSFGWHCRLCRLRYLFGFPALALLQRCFRRRVES